MPLSDYPTYRFYSQLAAKIPLNDVAETISTSWIFAGVKTTSGTTASTAHATPVTIFTPSGAAHKGTWIVTAYIDDVGGSYHATAFIVFDGTTATITLYDAGAFMTITMSGNAVQCTQSSGAAAAINWNALHVSN